MQSDFSLRLTIVVTMVVNINYFVSNLYEQSLTTIIRLRKSDCTKDFFSHYEKSGWFDVHGLTRI